MSRSSFTISGFLSCACGVLVATLLAGMLAASPAAAAAPRWRLESTATPTNLPPGGKGAIFVEAENLGDAEVNGAAETVEITDTLPGGLKASAISGVDERPGATDGSNPVEVNGAKVNTTCTLATLTCTFAGPLVPYGRLRVRIEVTVESTAPSGGENEVSISGGQTPPVSLSRPVTISSESTPFGVESYELTPEGEDGTVDAQAGSHPFQLTTSFSLNREAECADETKLGSITECVLGIDPQPAGGLPKNLRFNLPPGLVGNPTAVPRCTELEFETVLNGSADTCPSDSAVGVVAFTFNEPHSQHLTTATVPLFNLEPEPGEPARFGFNATRANIVLNTAVRTGDHYGITVSASNLTEVAGVVASTVTFWGEPDSPVHNQSRGWQCLSQNTIGEGTCEPLASGNETPFLTLPTLCAGPIGTPMEIDSWKEPGFLPALEPSAEPSISGCESLSFKPEIEVTPETKAVDSPTGLDFGLKVPQNEQPEGLATPELKDATVTLPAGMTIAPPAGQGLEACTEALFAVDSTEAAGCPEASKIGTVEVITPLLEKPLEGELFIGEPLCGNAAHPNECTPADAEDGSLFRLFLQARGSGVTVKLPGDATINQANDQVTTSFPEDPQLPFSELKLDLKGGPRAPLATPQSCAGLSAGPGGLPLAVSTSSLVPWSSPFVVTATPTAGFELSGCTNPMPFAPGFSLGTTSTQALASSELTTTLTRGDGQQDLSGISVTLPEGVAGFIPKAAQCSEAQANAGTCPEASRLGTAHVAAGAGSEPLQLEGPVYLTGPYNGDPFGLSIVVPAKAGPYNLGNEIVRAGISVNEHNGQVTVTSEPLRLARDGIPFRIKEINITIEREGFTFNPTNCDQLSATGSLTGQTPEGAPGSTVAVSAPYAVTGCAGLPFTPTLTAETHAGHTRKSGAYLKVSIASEEGQANLAKVHVTLPKALPSEDKTLEMACTEAQFAANPAGCPEAATVGSAVVHTPVLSEPLEGPAIFVSHGHAAFPDLDLVLKGEGVTIVQEGNTDIVKGFTSTTFAAIPDLPVSSIEVTLPQSEKPALAGEGNLCKRPLQMPTTITGQNGVVIEQKTIVKVQKCSTAFKLGSHDVKRRTLTLKVQVPAAGKLTASGKGLTGKSKRSTGSQTITFELKPRKQGKLTTKVKVVFEPTTGSKRTKTLAVKFNATAKKKRGGKAAH